MRGEETQLMGAALEHGVDGMVCLPGTHAKWASVRDGAVDSFQTFMTGEAYGLFARQSVLRHFVDETAPFAERAFRAAVADALAGPADVWARLFQLRAGPLLIGVEGEGDVAARLSGLLIGAEIAVAGASGPVTLLASGPLLERYSAAFDVAGLDWRAIDAENAARAGLLHAARRIWLHGASA